MLSVLYPLPSHTGDIAYNLPTHGDNMTDKTLDIIDMILAIIVSIMTISTIVSFLVIHSQNHAKIEARIKARIEQNK